MNNVKLMNEVINMYFQTLHTREQSRRIMVQSSILRKVYGIKEGEIVQGTSIPDYERQRVLSNKEVEDRLNDYIGYYEWALNKGDKDKAFNFKNEVYYFIEAVDFFDKSLALQLKTKFENSEVA